jgi:hypothetical protein
MMRARRWILSKGGIANCGTLARFYLAAMNQVPWYATAALPVEITNARSCWLAGKARFRFTFHTQSSDR